MMNFLANIIFFLKRPKIVIVAGKGRATAAEAIFQVLNQHFKTHLISPVRGRFSNGVNLLSKRGKNIKNYRLYSSTILKKEILIFEAEDQQLKNFRSLVKKSRLPILAVTNVGEIPSDRDFFAAEREKMEEIEKLAKLFPFPGYLILNFDDQTLREIKLQVSGPNSLTFGFQSGADFQVSDIRLNGGTNFKINYKGNIVPVWLENIFGKEQIYSALIAAGVGAVFGLNLVEVSQSLKLYQTYP